MSKDSLGDRMKDIEGRTRYMLPRRTYTIIRLDGCHFHTFTRRSAKPFDMSLMRCMQATMLHLCKNIMGCRLGYTQSDEITLVLTDFTELNSEAWFDGNLQKICSVSAAIATAEFNKRWILELISANPDSIIYDLIEDATNAEFDSRVYTTSDPWEAFNSVHWRQGDASKNSLQMVARSLYSHKELQGKKSAELHDMIHAKDQNWNNYPIDCKRGAFAIRAESGEWVVDHESPILSQDKMYFFKQVSLIPQPSFLTKEI